MRSSLNHIDTVNSIRLELPHPQSKHRLWLLVEGITDQKVYSKFVDSHVKVEIVHGGVNQLTLALSNLAKDTNRVLGIRDADFLNLNGQSAQPPLFQTDSHDLEMMIMSDDECLKHIICEYMCGHISDVKSWREETLQSISFIGGVRWLNDIECLDLNFSGLVLGNFYCGDTRSIDENKCVIEVLGRSPKRKRDFTSKEVTTLISKITDLLNLCHGADLVKAFHHHVLAKTTQSVGASEIEISLRIVYRIEELQKTKLFKKLQEWEKLTGYKLF